MSFNDPDFEVTEVSVNLRGYIDDITINNVHVLTRVGQRRQMRPTGSFIVSKGLMLLESILFDVDKFIAENTTQPMLMEN